MPRRIEMTRSEFQEKYGVEPDPSVTGMTFRDPRGRLITEVVFTDTTEAEAALEIAELERIYGDRAGQIADIEELVRMWSRKGDFRE